MKIYYSRSNDVDDSKINPQIESLVKGLGITSTCTITKYQRGTEYNSGDLVQADLVVVGVKEIFGTIGKGCFEEIQLAWKKNIPIVFFVEDRNTLYVPDTESDSFFTFLRQDYGLPAPDNWKKYAHLSDTLHSGVFVHYLSRIEDISDVDFSSCADFQKLLMSDLVWVDEQKPIVKEQGILSYSKQQNTIPLWALRRVV